MFGQTFSARIRSLTPSVEGKKAGVQKICTLGLQYEFTDDIAAGLGPVGKDALKYLRSRDQSEAKILMDAIGIMGEFGNGKSKHKLKDAWGIKAIAKQPTKEGAGPVLELSLAFRTTDKDALFFINHLEESIETKLDKVQLPLIEEE